MTNNDHLTVFDPVVNLDDIARDVSRRKYFLDAFENEKDALERCFSFLQQTRRYRHLVGQQEHLQALAEEIVREYLHHPAPHLVVFHSSPAVTALLERIFITVENGRSPLDLFCGIEGHVKTRLEAEKFAQFVKCSQYKRLCQAIRERRELPLGEILVDQRRTRFLELYLQHTSPHEVGNLLFWVEVQTIFLPLIQTNMFSVALFEEIQSTVRRIYNQFLTESSKINATLLSETIRKDTLKRIMMLQGEPFAPPRYAGLFRPAHEKIWQWLQSTVYPRFFQSPLYVQMVIEIENLESDLQLRRLSDHMQNSDHPIKSSSSVILPFPPHRRLSTGDSSNNARDLYSTTGSGYWSIPTSGALESSPERIIDVPELVVHGINVIAIVSVHTIELSNGKDMIRNELCVRSPDSAPLQFNVMDFIWNTHTVLTIPGVTSPSHQPQQLCATPLPNFHSFEVPHISSTIYGYCITRWRWHVKGRDTDVSAQRSRGDSSGLRESRPPAVCAPQFFYLLSSKPLQQLALNLLRFIADQAVDSIDGGMIRNQLAIETKSEDVECSLSLRPRLRHQYSNFYLRPQLDNLNFPLHWIFHELSRQNVIAILGALLVGKPLIIVSQRTSALTHVGHSILELLKPFEWKDFFLPFCPIRTANALVDRGFFTSANKSPYIIGLEGELVHIKTKESTTLADIHRHRIRNSIYTTHRLTLQLRPKSPASTTSSTSSSPGAVIVMGEDSQDDYIYASTILHAQALVLDVDGDDIYIPDRMDVPEYPQALARTVEASLKDALGGGTFSSADSIVFNTPKSGPKFVFDMVDNVSTCSIPSVDDMVRYAVISFLEALFGDGIFHFCSFRKAFVIPHGSQSTYCHRSGDDGDSYDDEDETYLLFEIDSFLDAKIEFGCREFFRQCFQTDLLRRFLFCQHNIYALRGARSRSIQGV